MTRAHEYRQLAEIVRAHARQEESPNISAQWERLAKTYVGLAEQTEPNDPFEDPIAGILVEHAIKRHRVPGTLKPCNKQNALSP